MGKHLKDASSWSWHSLLKLYCKAVTLIFSLFCVASGQLVKSAPRAQNLDEASISGRVFWADSTIAENIRVYLVSTFQPEYGIGVGPYFNVIDSTYSDESGNYIFAMPQYTYEVAVSDHNFEDTNENLSISDHLYLNSSHPSVTTLDLYLNSLPTSIVNNRNSTTLNERLHITRGRDVMIRVPEWQGSTLHLTAVNLRGETVSQLQSSSDGSIGWDTQRIAPGNYVLKISNGTENMTTRIVLK